MILAALLLQASLACDDFGTQMQMNICAAQRYEAADRELNRQWEVTAARMKAVDEAGSVPASQLNNFNALLKAQRAWLKFRDAHCESAGYVFRGGSMRPMVVGNCKADLTERRIQQLQQLLWD